MKKKLLSALLSTAMVASLLAGCGSDGAANNSSNDAASTDNSASTTNTSAASNDTASSDNSAGGLLQEINSISIPGIQSYRRDLLMYLRQIRVWKKESSM